MSPTDSTWKGRKKRFARRLAEDLRLLLPFIGLAGCFVLFATAIFAAERIPLAGSGVAESELPSVSAPRAKGPACDSVAEDVISPGEPDA